jgi:chloramphenicol O-acetyltransferase
MKARQIAAIDINKPLWLVHFFNNYTTADGKKTSACVFKFHHAMADGFAMMRLIFSQVQFEGEEMQV